MDHPTTTQVKKSAWEFNENAFKAFLTWLDDGVDSNGDSFLMMQRRLTAYFDRKGCSNPTGLADETMSRVARRLEEEGKIETEAPAKYCYTIARFVFLEHVRERERRGEVQLDELTANRRLASRQTDSDEQELKEKMLRCLDDCSEKLSAPDRSLIYAYYFGAERTKIENRRQMAERMVISVNALAIRACRIRNKLEACVKECAN